MKNVLLIGSIAYDQIMQFQDQFKNHILPDKIHILNVSFVIDSMKREFGGCATNIAYSLHLLDAKSTVLGIVGNDFEPYQKHLSSLKNINTTYLEIVDDATTATAHIVTDKDDNQIAGFYPGVSKSDLKTLVQDVEEKIDLALIGPTNKETMLNKLQECFDLDIPILFDPGQWTLYFSKEEWLQIIEQSRMLILNDYEWSILQKNAGLSGSEILEKIETLIVTFGAKGSHIFSDKETIEISAVQPNKLVDPTGCGDAYRAGILKGIIEGYDWQTAGRLASLLATYCIEQPGTQNHTFTLEELKKRYYDTFNTNITI